MLDLYKKNDDHLIPLTENEFSDDEVLIEIKKIKTELENDVCILGHHYQNDDVIQFADFQGDSLALAKMGTTASKPFIIFCGVHFMAETAVILGQDYQQVILPDLNAGCSMADMANSTDIEKAWVYFQDCLSEKNQIVPITYINCDAKLKAFVGRHGGTICTSSNAKKMIEWAFTQGEKLLFFPDQHLGRNTCFDLGIPLEQMVVYYPNKKNGGLTPEQIQRAKVILWHGFCSVHQGFTIEQIQSLRKNSPETKIIVHPECNFEVHRAADFSGSTSALIKYIEQSKPGDKIAVATEINLVNRLANQYLDRKIFSLSPYQCLCTTMYRVRPRWLLQSLLSIKNKNITNVIRVPQETVHFAKVALDRMLALS